MERLVDTNNVPTKSIDIFAGTGGFTLVIAPTNNYDGNDAVPFVDDAFPLVSKPLDEIIDISIGERRRPNALCNIDIVSGGPECQAFSVVHYYTPPKPKESWELKLHTNTRDNILTRITQEEILYTGTGSYPESTYGDGEPSLIENVSRNNQPFNLFQLSWVTNI